MDVAKHYIRFSEFWHKLTKLEVGYEFTTIRSPEKYFYYHDIMRREESVAIMLTERSSNPVNLCLCKILNVEKKRLFEITDQEVAADTYPSWTRQAFLVYMRKWYSRKKWWKENYSEMIVISLKVEKMLTK